MAREPIKTGQRQWQIRQWDLSTQRLDVRRVTAVSAQVAGEQVATDRQLVLSITEVTADDHRPAGTRTKFDVAWWCHELKALLMAGMTVTEALDALNAETKVSERRWVLASLSTKLAAGKSLSAAMESVNVFPSVLIAGVVAGERSGELVPALEDYLAYQRMIDRLFSKARAAAVYPTLVLVIGFIVIGLLLLFVMPRFSLIYRDRPDLQNGLSGSLLAFSVWISAHRIAVLGAVTTFIGGCVLAFGQPAFRNRLVLMVEFFGPARTWLDEFRKAKFYQSLAVMIRGGYALDESLLRCRGLGLGSRFERAVAIIHDAVTKGTAPAEAFARSGLTDPITERLLRVAERTGSMVPILQALTDRHADRFSTAVDRLARLVEPLLLLLVSLAVGTVVVLMYLPIFDLASGIR
ncbi:MAG: type II secretion system F family protein [Azoarcus sp.]|nr:type II secretion system F family protein [Azoarcus sp.]